jgi:DNA helicase HerA-like ATPase
LKLYRKEADVVQIISFPGESVEKGNYLLIEDETCEKGMIVQIIDIQFANIPGILEELLRDVMGEENLSGHDVDPLAVSSQITVLKDAKLLVCKIRGTLDNGCLSSNVGWLPSRTGSRIVPLSPKLLLDNGKITRHLSLGAVEGDHEVVVDAKKFDAKLNIVTGRKGTGKSHLTKLLVLGLVSHHAPCVILDVNGEYANLGRLRDGGRSPYADMILVLSPQVNLRFTLAEVGLPSMMSVLYHALDLPGNSARVFAKIWHELEKARKLSLAALGEAIASWECHESIREALHSRYNTLVDSGLFTDEDTRSLHEDQLVQRLTQGCALVVSMKNQSSTIRRMIVELLISKITQLLSTMRLRALFLFAEEAHLYLRDTYWEDIVTRMRHLGVFATFITNQPDTIQEGIYRQADNIFLFNFANDRDLDVVSRAAKVDADSIRLLVRDLPTGHCLTIGDVVQNFPMVVHVREIDAQTMGETRYFFE